MLFGVGLNKTGTTTLGDACAILGLSRRGWVGKAGPGIRGHQLMRWWTEGDLDSLAAVASEYDVLEDLPWPMVYAAMADRFPDARFVLTRRKSTETWLKSQIVHTSDRPTYGMHVGVYGARNPAEDPDIYRAKYERHNSDVRAFFAGTDRLLEVCWEQGDGWAQLGGFLGLPVPDRPFPHSNPRPKQPSRLRVAVSNLVH